MAKSASQRERVAATSGDVLAAQVEQLRRLFPECVAEGKVDFDKLRATLGGAAAAGPGRFSFSWAGKDDALALLQTPARGTLVPCPEESVNFETTGHAFIEGENLEVLKLLFKPYFGRVKLIYIDPPYNTGNDFVYPDDFADPLKNYLIQTGQIDDDGNLASSKVDRAGRVHSSWLSMMYPRLFLARQLLREDGFLVVSIDDAEFHHLRLVLNEVFGEENFVATLVWDRNRKNDAKLFSVGHEYMLVYARDLEKLREDDVVLRVAKEGIGDVRATFESLVAMHGDDWNAVQEGLKTFYGSIPDDDSRAPMKRYTKADGRGPYRDDGDISWPGGGGPRYEVLHPTTGKPCKVPKRGWVYGTPERMQEEIDAGSVAFGDDETTVPSLKAYLFEKSTQVMQSVNYSYAQVASQSLDKIFGGSKVFDNPKHHDDLARIVTYLSENEDLVMDFFAGSGSTAHAVLEVRTRARITCPERP